MFVGDTVTEDPVRLPGIQVKVVAPEAVRVADWPMQILVPADTVIGGETEEVIVEVAVLLAGLLSPVSSTLAVRV